MLLIAGSFFSLGVMPVLLDYHWLNEKNYRSLRRHPYPAIETSFMEPPLI